MCDISDSVRLEHRIVVADESLARYGAERDIHILEEFLLVVEDIYASISPMSSDEKCTIVPGGKLMAAGASIV